MESYFYFCIDYLNPYWRPLISAHCTAGLIKYRDPYRFGVDPSWRGSRTELPFLNSLKMKMSILFGVTQMNLGIVLSYFNAKFFGNSLDVWYVFARWLDFLGQKKMSSFIIFQFPNLIYQVGLIIILSLPS